MSCEVRPDDEFRHLARVHLDTHAAAQLGVFQVLRKGQDEVHHAAWALLHGDHAGFEGQKLLAAAHCTVVHAEKAGQARAVKGLGGALEA